MRKISLKEENIKSIIAILRTPKNPQAGAQYAEQVKTLPVIDKLENLKFPDVGTADLLLEEAEWELLVDRMKTAGYLIISHDITDMVDTISDAEKVEVKEASG